MRASPHEHSPPPAIGLFSQNYQPQHKWQCLYLKVPPPMLFAHSIG